MKYVLNISWRQCFNFAVSNGFHRTLHTYCVRRHTSLQIFQAFPSINLITQSKALRVISLYHHQHIASNIKLYTIEAHISSIVRNATWMHYYYLWCWWPLFFCSAIEYFCGFFMELWNIIIYFLVFGFIILLFLLLFFAVWFFPEILNDRWKRCKIFLHFFPIHSFNNKIFRMISFISDFSLLTSYQMTHFDMIILSKALFIFDMNFHLIHKYAFK